MRILRIFFYQLLLTSLALSPWTALEYCVDQPGQVNDTWVCHSPDSCGCSWESSPEMLILQPRGCKDMGSDAKVALYAPSQLAPYLSLPTSIGGSTGYISTTKINGTSTWISTVIPGCKLQLEGVSLCYPTADRILQTHRPQ